MLRPPPLLSSVSVQEGKQGVGRENQSRRELSRNKLELDDWF
jgi:hypothetical protein